METLLGGFGRGSIWLGSYCVCNCYHAALTTQNAMMTRIWHIVIFLCYLVGGWLVHNYIPILYRVSPITIDICPEETCSLLIINRISLALFVFHLLLALILFGTTRADQPLASFQNQTWGAKFLLLLVLLVGCAFVPEWVFLFYGWISVVAAFLFIFVEIVIVADMGHTIILHMNHKRQYLQSVFNPTKAGHQPSRDPNDLTASDIAGVVVTLSLALGSIGLIVYSSWLFESLPQCRLNIMIMILWLVIVLTVMFVTFCSKVSQTRQELGALGASMVIFYATFLLWNASVVDDPGQCTAPFVPYGPIYWITTSIGTAIALVLITYSSLIIRTTPYIIDTDRFTKLQNYESGDHQATMQQEFPFKPNPQDSYNYSKINFMFALASPYICMLLTNWSVIRRYKNEFATDGDNTDIIETSLGWVSLIADISAAWVLLLVYIYFVCYPYCCPPKTEQDQ